MGVSWIVFRVNCLVAKNKEFASLGLWRQSQIFVICDEVTSALDQIVQGGILKLLMKLQKDLNLTYLFITHDISTVKAISDQVVVMNLGEVVEQKGLKDEVFNPPHPLYTELLLSSVPEMDPDWLTNLNSERA